MGERRGRWMHWKNSGRDGWGDRSREVGEMRRKLGE